jgi:AcrR family transcriptional regulator
MEPQESRSPLKETQILDGAAMVFARDGFGRASMSQIAAAAGVSKGTLYNYFPGKEALFAAWVQRECSVRIALIFDDLTATARPAETLRRIGRRMLEMLLSDSGLLVYRMVVAEAGHFPSLAEAFFAAGPQRAVASLAGWIRSQVAAGTLAVNDAEFAAEQLFSLMQTRLLMRRRLGLQDGVQSPQIEHVVDEAVTLFLRGYGATARDAGQGGPPNAYNAALKAESDGERQA